MKLNKVLGSVVVHLDSNGANQFVAHIVEHTQTRALWWSGTNTIGESS